MKSFLIGASLLVILFAACTKNAADVNNQHTVGIVGRWRLVQKQNSVARPATEIIDPAKDSVVTLSLDSNGNYASMLNNNTIAYGTYGVATDSAYNNQQELQLNNFNTTGIFNVFTMLEIDSAGQVIKSSDYFYFKLSSDTMYLTTPITPGGNIGYTFVKQ